MNWWHIILTCWIDIYIYIYIHTYIYVCVCVCVCARVRVSEYLSTPWKDCMWYKDNVLKNSREKSSPVNKENICQCVDILMDIVKISEGRTAVNISLK